MINKVLKNIRMFVTTSIHRGGKTCQTSAGIFYAFADRILYGFVPPCGALMRPLPLWWKSMGKAKPFLLYGFVPPCWSVNAPTASKVLSNGKGETVFYFRLPRINKSVMTSTGEICSGVNYSSPLTTSSTRNVETLLSILSLAQTHPKTAAVLVRLKYALEAEYNAKQRAYNFIAAKGLMAEFCGVKTGKKRNLKKRV